MTFLRHLAESAGPVKTGGVRGVGPQQVEQHRQDSDRTFNLSDTISQSPCLAISRRDSGLFASDIVSERLLVHAGQDRQAGDWYLGVFV